MKSAGYLVLLCLLLGNCSSPEEDDLTTDQIIFLTPYYEEYVKAAKDHNKKYQDSCLRKRREFIFIRYFSKCENAQLFNEDDNDTILINSNPDDLSKAIQLLNTNEQIIKKRIEIALANCYKYLRYDGVRIFVGPSSLKKEWSEKMGGVSGLTPGSKHILLFVDPSIPGWENQLEVSLAHEFNHAYWTKYNNDSYSYNLLEWMVCEGKAEAFSHIVYPKISSPWDSVIPAVQKRELWDTIKLKLNSRDYELNANIMFGDNGYPRCCGYILGRNIVEAALKKSPNMEAKNWTNLSADYILKESGYK
jgi:uncharacterized protein YjaZ